MLKIGDLVRIKGSTNQVILVVGNYINPLFPVECTYVDRFNRVHNIKLWEGALEKVLL